MLRLGTQSTEISSKSICSKNVIRLFSSSKHKSVVSSLSSNHIYQPNVHSVVFSQSQMLPPSLGDDMLRHSASVPLRPPSIIHWHTWMPTLVCGQSHVACRNGWATGNTEWAAQVHPRPGKERLEPLSGQEVTRRGQEGAEGHADGTRDMAGLCVCQSEKEGREWDLSEMEVGKTLDSCGGFFL